MDDALPPPPPGLEVDWDHERVTVRLRPERPVPLNRWHLAEVGLLGISWLIVGHGAGMATGAPWVAEAAWVTALPLALASAWSHHVAAGRRLEVCCTPTGIELRLLYGRTRLLTRIQPIDELRRSSIRPSRHAGGSPVLRLESPRRLPLDVKLVGFDRHQARWILALVEHARRRHARFRAEALATGQAAAALDALRARASKPE